jgi:glutamine cyclotransferase
MRGKYPALTTLVLVFSLLASLTLAIFHSPPTQAQSAPPERLSIEILRSFDHDPEAHTQGLVFDDGALYESEGKDRRAPGAPEPALRSSLRELDPATGALRRQALRSDYWAEGLALVPGGGGTPDRLVQLSYKAGRAVYYDRASFDELSRVDYELAEGWGLCYDAPRGRLVMSDGSSRLHFREPGSFASIGSTEVRLEGRPLAKLNELECVGDVVYANIFPDIGRPELNDTIARIDLESGEVTGLVAVGDLLTAEERAGGVAELNGIAHDADAGSFYLTGKLWPRMFEVRLKAQPPASPTPDASATPEPSVSVEPSTATSAPPTATSAPPTATPDWSTPEAWKVEVLERLPHDETIYTQGLLLHEGLVYESAGNPSSPVGGPGRPSSLRAWDPRTGVESRSVELDPAYYGEGLALVKDRLFWITWMDGLAFVFGRDRFEELDRIPYVGEGWGLCYDGQELFMSDGSDRLIRRDAESFAVLGEVAVQEAGRPLRQLNELECADDAVFANVWKTEDIVRIDKRSGRVTARIDASGLRPASATNREAVLNGIAHDATDGSYLITGKWWDVMYRVRFGPEREPVAPIYLPFLARNVPWPG